MAIQVFVSHTQRDEEFCDIFDREIKREGYLIKNGKSAFLLERW